MQNLSNHFSRPRDLQLKTKYKTSKPVNQSTAICGIKESSYSFFTPQIDHQVCLNPKVTRLLVIV